ncbi:MAG: hypothetical protein AAGC95_01985 [Pseudomonadota bacterium]
MRITPASERRANKWMPVIRFTGAINKRPERRANKWMPVIRFTGATSNNPSA